MEMRQKEGIVQQNLLGALKSNRMFGTFVNAIDVADLSASLRGHEQYTLFAPTDEAFSALPVGTLDRLLRPEHRDELTSLVNYHLVRGRKTVADVRKWHSARTMQGQEAPVQTNDGQLTIGRARITQPDIVANNGMIHGIDKVNVPIPLNPN